MVEENKNISEALEPENTVENEEALEVEETETLEEVVDEPTKETSSEALEPETVEPEVSESVMESKPAKKMKKEKEKLVAKMPKISKNDASDARKKKILVRVLPVMAALIVVILVAVLISVFTRDPKLPTIKNPKAPYIENDVFDITRGSVYQNLKDNYGLTTIINKVDKEILSTEKNKDGKSYLEAITDEELNKEFDKRMYGDKEITDPDEKAKKEKAFRDKMFLAGLRDDQSIKDMIRLELARKAFAYDKILKEYNEATEEAKKLDKNKAEDKKRLDELKDKIIDDEAINKKFKETNHAELSALFMSFPTQLIFEKTLRRYDVAFMGYQKKWVSISEKRELTLGEIGLTFIKLYNEFYQGNIENFPDTSDPTKNQYLKEGVHYTYDTTTKTLTFLNAGVDAIKANYDTFQKYAKGLYDLVNGKKEFTNTENHAKPESIYTVKTETKENKQWLFFLVKKGEEPKLTDEKKQEIVDTILKERLKDARVSKEMNELRKEINFIDYNLAKQFKQQFYKDYKIKKQNGKSTAAVYKNLTFGCDELFTELLGYNGSKDVLTKIQRTFLLRHEKNKIYDVKNKKVLDKSGWNDVQSRIQNIKTAFAADRFKTYGFPQSYGWEAFVKTYFQISSLKELEMAVLASILEERFGDGREKITKEFYEKNYLTHAQKAYDEYFDVSGNHVLISVKGKDGKPLAPEKWTEAQRKAAEELYDKLFEELKGQNPDNQIKYMEKFASSSTEDKQYIASLRYNPLYNFNQAEQEEKTFDKGKFEIGTTTVETASVTKDDYKYSKYVTLGLEVKYEALNNSKPGKMVKPFEEALKRIWARYLEDKTINKAHHTLFDRSANNGEYLKTEFGYHVFRVSRVDDIRNKIEKENNEDVLKNLPLPSFDKVSAYLKDKNDKSLTSEDKKLIETFVVPVHNEYISKNCVKVELLKEIKGKLGEMKLPENIKKEDVERVIDIQVATLEEKFKYFLTK